MQELGLQRRYELDEGFALQAKMLPSLAFIPPADVIEAFEVLTEGEYLAVELGPVIDYFEDTWIGRRRGCHNARRLPRFEIALWNCYESVRDGLSKMNNSCEGWHRGFHQLVGGEHPSIWNFIRALQRDQSVNELKAEQYLAGQPVPQGKRKYRDCAIRIRNIVDQYDHEWLEGGNHQGLIDYLRGLSHNYNF